MSATVDRRIVEMRFDNRKFESNVSTTISSLEKLKQSLDLTGATKGFENVQAAANQIDLSQIESTACRAGFSLRDVWLKVATVFEYQIARRITNAATNIAKALTIDPIKTGLSEYETQINAVQTILANTESKGTTLDQVNAALDELNTYADKTIYNFTEMTKNIGTFTAAGVDLDTSVKSIQGIANLAAVSGSTSQQASTAMYQLSQALSSGTVRLQDWNSVVNAGMGGQVFQDALKRTAKSMGTDVDKMIDKYGSFRESLTKGEWLTAEVLTKALEQFTMSAEEGSKQWEEYKKSLISDGYTEQQAEEILKMANTATDAATKVKTATQLWDTLKETAQSGWTQTWEILLGDFEEAKEFFSDLYSTFSPMIEATSKARNDLLQGWSDLGGRTDLIDSLYNIIEGITSIVKPIKEAFRDIFPPMTAKQLKSFTEGLKNLTEKIKIGDETADKLKRTFKGLFAIIDIVKQIFGAAFKAVTSLFGGVGKLGGGLLDISARFGDCLVKINELIKSGNLFNKIFETMAKVSDNVARAFRKVLKFTKEKFVMPGWEILHTILRRVYDLMCGVGEAAIGTANLVKKSFNSIGESMEGSSFFAFLQSIWNGVITIGSGITKAFGAIIEGVVNIFSGADFGDALDIVNTLITGGLGVSIIKFFDNITEIFKGLQGITDNTVGILESFRNIFEAYQTTLKGNALLKIAAAIGILTLSLIMLTTIDGDKLMTSALAIGTLFSMLFVAMSQINKLNTGLKGVIKLNILSDVMRKLAKAILILAIAMKIMSTMSTEEMLIGLVSMAGGLMALVTTIKMLPEKNINSAAKAIKKLSTALVIFALAMKIMGTLSWKEMGVALISTVVGLAALVGAVNLLPASKVTSAAKAIQKMSVALLILAAALKIMGSMSWQEMGIGLISMAGGLVLLVAAVNLLPNNTALKVAGIIGLSTAMVILAAALKIMGSMSWQEMGIGLIALAGSLLILAGGVIAMSAAIPGALAMLIVAPALVILASALLIMNKVVEGGNVGKIIGLLAGSLMILAISLTIMIMALPGAAALVVAAGALAILAPVLAILGAMSWEAIIKGLISIAGAFTILGIAGTVLGPLVPTILGLAGAFALIGLAILGMGVGLLAAGAGLSAMAVGFTALATALIGGATAIVASITVIVTGIINLIPAIAQKIGEAIIVLCTVIGEGVPAIAKAFKAIFLAIIDVVTSCIPPLLECFGVLLDGILNLIVKYVPKLVEAGLKLITGLLRGIANNIGDVLDAGVDVVLAFINGIAKQIAKVVKAAIDLMLKFINGLADGIRKYTSKMLDAVNNLMSSVFEAIGMAIGNVPKMGTQIVQGLIKGIKSSAGDLLNSMVGVVKKAWNGVLDFLGINSPSRLAAEAGMGINEGLVVGLKKYAKDTANAAVGVGKTTINSLKETVGNISDILNGDIDSQPTIRPVLDLSNIKNGAGAISSMLGNGTSVGVLTNVGAINSTMSRQNQNGGNDDVVSAINKLRKDIGNMKTETYSFGDITYDDGSNITDAVKTIVRAAKVERRK